MFIRRTFVHFKRSSPLNLLLINMGLLDELFTGFFFIGLPLLRSQLGLTYEQIGLIFSAAALSSIVVEPPLYLLSERGLKRWWILGGLIGLACAYALAGSVNSFIILMLAFILMYPANSMAVGLSQAALIDNAPGDGTRIMTRWTMLSGIGDFLSPLAVTAIVSLGLGWSGLCWIAAGCWLAAALVLWFQHFPQRKSSYSQKEDDDEPAMSIGAAARAALRDTVLLRWIVLSMLTTMLDEIFLTFTVLYLRDGLRASPLVSGLTVSIDMAGGLLGLFLLDRLLGRIAPLRLLQIAALLALAGVIGLLLVRDLWFAPLAFFVVSLGGSCLYPIAEAQAYARLPGRSSMIRFVSSLGQPFEIVLPLIVGFVAERFGPLASLAVLGSAPVFFLLLVPRKRQPII